MYTFFNIAPLAQETPSGGLGKDMNIYNPGLLCDLTLLPEMTVPPTDRWKN